MHDDSGNICSKAEVTLVCITSSLLNHTAAHSSHRDPCTTLCFQYKDGEMIHVCHLRGPGTIRSLL